MLTDIVVGRKPVDDVLAGGMTGGDAFGVLAEVGMLHSNGVHTNGPLAIEMQEFPP
ncbi:MAG: hypothetical protein JXQ73_24365 [Phycisphaerae bacterium]|nr:hypothetical protein [Phycisphaerae bacterium]